MRCTNWTQMTRPNRILSRSPVQGGILGEVEVPGKDNLTSGGRQQTLQVTNDESPLSRGITAG